MGLSPKKKMFWWKKNLLMRLIYRLFHLVSVRRLLLMLDMVERGQASALRKKNPLMWLIPEMFHSMTTMIPEVFYPQRCPFYTQRCPLQNSP